MRALPPLLLLALLLPGAAPLSTVEVHRRCFRPRPIRCSAAASNGDGGDPDAPPSYGPDLRSLLPSPKKRTLRLDKFGRRVHDLTDDGTSRYDKAAKAGGIGIDPAAREVVDMAAAAVAAVGQLERLSSSTVAEVDVSGEAFGPLARAAGPASSQEVPVDDASATAASSGGGGGNASSDLKALLPDRKMRFLKLDKFGRRIQRMEDDGTVNVEKEPVAATTTGGADDGAGDGSAAADAPEAARGPPLAALLGTPDKRSEASTRMTSDAVLEEGDRSVDLKELLPKQRMRFMKLDKFGRRVQRMEDDGTVNVEKEPVATREGVDEGDDGAAAAADDVSEPVHGPPLAALLGTPDKRSEASTRMTSDAVLEEGDRSVDLKELLPKQRMRFMKLDKFGRRVQRMEDDGTVNMRKEPAAGAGTAEDGGEGGSVVKSDAPPRGTSDAGDAPSNPNYGSLKELLPEGRETWTKLDFKGGTVVDDRRTKQSNADDAVGGGLLSGSGLKDLLPKRPLWTKLDFHGAPVADDRRMKQTNSNGNTGSGNDGAGDDGESVRSGGSLKDLMPKREIWTKLDFHGASVVDERRVARKGRDPAGSGGGGFNEGEHSNLTTLLPERTITWKKTQVLSSGSAPFVGAGGRGLREERQRAMREEVVASAGAVDGTDDGDNAGAAGTSEDAKAYTNLKDLLPERKMTWR